MGVGEGTLGNSADGMVRQSRTRDREMSSVRVQSEGGRCMYKRRGVSEKLGGCMRMRG